jgi:WD domain, G-beta repeat
VRLSRRHSMFFPLYAIVGVAIALEAAGRLEKSETDSPDRTGLAEEANVVQALFPDSPESDYIRGMNAKYLRYDLAEARRYFERALSSGIKSHQELFYDYAVVLFLMEGNSAKTDAAVAAWRKNAPDSTRLDPREFNPRFPEWLQAGSLRPMSLSSDGRLFALARPEGDVALLDLVSGTRSSIPIPQSDRVQHLFGFSRDGNLLAGGDSGGQIVVLNVDNLNVKARRVGHTGGALCAEFSPDDKFCAVGSVDHTIRLWEIESTKEPVGESDILAGHTRPVSSLTFSPDGTVLASGSWDGAIRLWDLSSQPITSVALKGHQAVITGLAFSEHGRWLASAARDNMVRIWDVSSGELRHELKGHAAPVAAVDCAPYGRLLASGGGDNSVKIWDAESGELIESHEGIGKEGVCAVAFTPDGRTVISLDFQGSLRPVRLPVAGR